MKKSINIFVVLSIMMSVMSVACARNTPHLLPINAALSTPAAQQKLNHQIPLFFSNESHPRILTNFGYYVSNRKTNSFGKTDAAACNWAFLAAVKTLQQRAQAVGANAIVNIISYYDKKPMANKTHFECHAGALIAGVALKGDVVKIAK